MTQFYRLSGGGNDFLALVEPRREPSALEIRAWCTRGLSVGADGLFVLRRDAGGAVMKHYNADGRAATLCINGTRCAARLALELGWSRTELVVSTGAGEITASAAGRHEITLSLPALAGEPRELEVAVVGASLRGWQVDVGVPHFVVPWPEPLGDAPLARLGPPLRRHEAFGSAGANIDLVRYPSRRRLEIRTWERGVEGETLACGSGVLAAAVAGRAAGELDDRVRALTAGGFELTVELGPEGRLRLTGDARLVASGRLLPEALELPRAPEWS